MKTVFGKARQVRTLARKGIQMGDMLKAAFYGLPAVAFSIGLAFWDEHRLGKRKKNKEKLAPRRTLILALLWQILGVDRRDWIPESRFQ